MNDQTDNDLLPFSKSFWILVAEDLVIDADVDADVDVDVDVEETTWMKKNIDIPKIIIVIFIGDIPPLLFILLVCLLFLERMALVLVGVVVEEEDMIVSLVASS